MRALPFLFFVLSGFLMALQSLGQSNRLNHWWQYSGSYWINPQWAVTAHLQYRSYQLFKDPRVGYVGGEVQHAFKDVPISLGAGYAHLFNRNYVTEEETELTHENRLYQNLTLRGSVGGVGISHRYQVEERWLRQGYHTRLRYQLALRIPLGPKEQEERPWYGILRNEVRVIIRDQPFDSNRVYGGLGYTFNKHFTLEGMWMSQLVGRGGNHVHFTMFVLRHDFGRME
ncbi:DUF2490 domain-containing protein [Rufibacter glacialis]|uniref:DUF2490 domain-containing protein n=1 Tax=Rufibacter glacialis TaxID=1259555 RepID=A0A5M8QEP0_9BACT|nr:DUF2490 domain-containing protein [Rufibacter glacialis]KAA6433453.1 DUF2490 domain-containing protein [Rufibacter glacialis]GGK74076.1 hypothetical protein GCM10011405_22670 [Rufibacter glacialis]